MSRVLLEIAFDGTDFCGWQVQPNGISVQQTLQDALNGVLGYRPDVTGCSRTDSGVHAWQYFCHFDLAKPFDLSRLPSALNFYLPSSVAAVSCRKVNSDFHARYSCKGKTYVYRIWNERYRNPFWARFSYHVPVPLDVSRMQSFAAAFLGTHDFCGFMSKGSDVADTVRTITDISVSKLDGMISISVTADGFLYNMVRIIAGTILLAGLGKLEPDKAEKIIASRERKNAGATLPPCGLTLERVYYDFDKDGGPV